MNSATIQISMELWGAIFCLIFAAFIWIGEDKKTRQGNMMIEMLMLVFAILVSDSFAWGYRGVPGKTAWYAVRISNYLVFALNYPIGFTAVRYLEEILAQDNRKLPRPVKAAVSAVCLTGLVLATVSQFTGFLYTIDENNVYHRADGYWTISVVAILLVVMVIGMIVRYSNKKTRPQTVPLLMVFVLMLTSALVQSLFYGISLVNIGMVAGVVVMFFGYEKDRIAISGELKTRLLENDLKLAQQEKALAQKDAEMAAINIKLTEQRTQIMLSQIKPHFLYNALAAISALCIRDPMKARETTDNFAYYLRANLNSLTNDHMIPFKQELKHTQAYLAIEQTRFGEDLSVVYDIQCEDFKLPSLSLQPIVENAVRHGICGNEDGGTVTIRTRAADGKILISVQDTGIGFDTSARPARDGRQHVGMESVSQRVRALCGGDMVIDSTPGYGTTVTITLPVSGQ